MLCFYYWESSKHIYHSIASVDIAKFSTCNNLFMYANTLYNMHTATVTYCWAHIKQSESIGNSQTSNSNLAVLVCSWVCHMYKPLLMLTQQQWSLSFATLLQNMTSWLTWIFLLTFLNCCYNIIIITSLIFFSNIDHWLKSGSTLLSISKPSGKLSYQASLSLSTTL